MVWNNRFDPATWYIQHPRDEHKAFAVFELTTFQKDSVNSCIWINADYLFDWTRYNSLYFSNGVIGVYNPEEIHYGELIRIDFENSLDTLSIKKGLCYSFLNQFDIGLENSEVIDGINRIVKLKK